MPSLTIKPPRLPSEATHSSSPPPPQSAFTFIPPNTTANINPFHHEAPSPVAPEYSPITPKVQPALPAIYSTQSHDDRHETFAPPANTQPQPADHHEPIAQHPAPAIPPAQYIPQPPPQPFSSEDSIDAIALRSAISALQFQKKKARDDIRTLEATRKQALDDPLRFRDELAAGRLKEQRPELGGLQAILDAPDSDDADDNDEDGQLAPNALHSEEDGAKDKPAEKPDVQPSDSAPFARIPGPQNVIRMPHINWDKYHIVGEPLEALHEQQRRWPGSSSTGYGQDHGREFSVAAPYSPFYDVLDGEAGMGRKDSVALSAAPSAVATPTTGISEHPMETRRSSGKPQ